MARVAYARDNVIPVHVKGKKADIVSRQHDVASLQMTKLRGSNDHAGRVAANGSFVATEKRQQTYFVSGCHRLRFVAAHQAGYFFAERDERLQHDCQPPNTVGHGLGESRRIVHAQRFWNDLSKQQDGKCENE